VRHHNPASFHFLSTIRTLARELGIFIVWIWIIPHITDSFNVTVKTGADGWTGLLLEQRSVFLLTYLVSNKSWSKKHHWNWAWWLPPVISATLEVEIRKIAAQGHLVQKVSETPCQPIKIWAWWSIFVIPSTQEAIIRESQSRLAQAQIQDPIWKVIRAKGLGCVSVGRVPA
jgi:hypothetical protein